MAESAGSDAESSPRKVSKDPVTGVTTITYSDGFALAYGPSPQAYHTTHCPFFGPEFKDCPKPTCVAARAASTGQ